eukprot:scaffold45118_cov17-Tisochrysis_lutea.AAC.1
MGRVTVQGLFRSGLDQAYGAERSHVGHGCRPHGLTTTSISGLVAAHTGPPARCMGGEADDQQQTCNTTALPPHTGLPGRGQSTRTRPERLEEYPKRVKVHRKGQSTWKEAHCPSRQGQSLEQEEIKGRQQIGKTTASEAARSMLRQEMDMRLGLAPDWKQPSMHARDRCQVGTGQQLRRQFAAAVDLHEVEMSIGLENTVNVWVRSEIEPNRGSAHTSRSA